MTDYFVAAHIVQTKHGHAKRGAWTRTYRSWYAMRRRCNDPKNISWWRYGGRGISVVARWNDFSVFLADMGECPSPQHSLDRIDNQKDYSPANCRWATRKEQCNNRTSNVLVLWGGREQNIRQWADELGLPYATLYRRLVVLGWEPTRALMSPIRVRRLTP